MEDKLKNYWGRYYELKILGLPRWLSGKESTCQCRTRRFNPWVRRSPGEGNGNPLRYSCLKYPMDRGAWWTTVQGVTRESEPTEHTLRARLRNLHLNFTIHDKGSVKLWRLDLSCILGRSSLNFCHFHRQAW